MRVQLRRQLVDSAILWRLTESDGELVTRWLPNEGPLEPLDRGGFDSFQDAHSFALGIDQVRAEAGFLGDVDIAAERAELDADQRHGRRPAPDAFEAA